MPPHVPIPPDGTRTCTRCNRLLPIGHFSKDAKMKQGIRSRCKDCGRKDTADWTAKNPEKVQKNARRAKLRSRGATESKYNELFTRQDGLCAVCLTGASPRKYLDVDHCHRTGIVRGLLCRKCNHALGLLKENKNIIHDACEYLSSSEFQPISKPYRAVPSPPYWFYPKLKQRFGLDKNSFLCLWIRCGGYCSICRSEPENYRPLLAIDHCHITGKIRGLLCTACNTAIAACNDNSVILRKLSAYISSFECL